MDNALSRVQVDKCCEQSGPGENSVVLCSEGLNAADDPETSRRVCSDSVAPEIEPLLSVGSSKKLSSTQRKDKFIPLHNGKAPRVQFESDLEPPGTPSGSVSSSSSSSSSSSDDDSVSVAEARAPDGGWGWVVVFASFIINMIADGITFSFGIFFVQFLEYFGESNAKTAWVASIFMAMPLLSGPIASFLTDRYGCRKMTVIGSLIASLGFVLSVFANNLEVLFFTFGIMSGFGLSLCYVAAVVVVAYYFEKKRSLATGISVCGSGIGTFLFAPLTNMLLNEYGWRGTTLIMAGLLLNMAFCGLLMRDLPWTTMMIKAKARDRKLNREKKRRKRQGSTIDSVSDSKSSTIATSGTTGQSTAGAGDSAAVDNPIETLRCSSAVDLPTFFGAGENLPIEVLELISNRREVCRVLMHAYPNLMLPSRSFSDSGRLHEADRVPSPRTSLVKAEEEPRHMKPAAQFTHRLPAAFLRDLRLHRRSLTYRGAMLNITRYRLRASSCPNIFRNSMTTIAKEKEVWYAGLWDFWDLAVDVLDFSHLSKPKFLVFVISNFLLYTWYDIPYVYIASYAGDLGYKETDTSMLISTIGIVNMFGEILIGWIGDWPNANSGVIYAISMFICGCVTCVIPMLTGYTSLMAASGAFGFFIAANYSLTSIILVQIITLEKFTNAYGLLLLMQGIANLVGPPLGGWLSDITSSYDLSFYLAGIFIAVSGLLMFILPIVRCVMRNQKKTSSEDIRAENGHIKADPEKFYL